jgi:hypothetical protein
VSISCYVRVREFRLSADYATLVPVADTVNALLTSLPAYDLNLFTDQLEAGNPLAAVGDPIAADLALVPFAFGYGAAATVLEAGSTSPEAAQRRRSAPCRRLPSETSLDR